MSRRIWYGHVRSCGRFGSFTEREHLISGVAGISIREILLFDRHIRPYKKYMKWKNQAYYFYLNHMVQFPYFVMSEYIFVTFEFKVEITLLIGSSKSHNYWKRYSSRRYLSKYLLTRSKSNSRLALSRSLSIAMVSSRW